MEHHVVNHTATQADVPSASPYEAPCPLVRALKVIGGKWKLPIIWHTARAGSIRYNALLRMLVGISPMMLTQCLKELAQAGVIARRDYDENPPRVEYSLTPRGATLLPTLEGLARWGEEHTPEQR